MVTCSNWILNGDKEGVLRLPGRLRFLVFGAPQREMGDGRMASWKPANQNLYSQLGKYPPQQGVSYTVSCWFLRWVPGDRSANKSMFDSISVCGFLGSVPTSFGGKVGHTVPV